LWPGADDREDRVPPFAQDELSHPQKEAVTLARVQGADRRDERSAGRDCQSFTPRRTQSIRNFEHLIRQTDERRRALLLARDADLQKSVGDRGRDDEHAISSPHEQSVAQVRDDR